jgi:hypothetical protein
MSLRLKTIAALQQRGEPVTYRELTDLLWSAHPELKEARIEHYGSESRARKELRIRLGALVKELPSTFSSSMGEGVVLVGLVPQEGEERLDDIEAEEEELDGPRTEPSVYWYTFPAYRSKTGPYPIKIGRGTDPEARIRSQVTAMPEQPIVLGKYEHADPTTLERALHSVLILRGKRKMDAPGTEWFVTTPEEIEALIATVLA